MILEFEDEKGLLDAQTRALMQTCSQAMSRFAKSTVSSAARTPRRTCSPSRR